MCDLPVPYAPYAHTEHTSGNPGGLPEVLRRELKKHERLEYLEAVRCLASKPDVTGGLENATNLYQSFQATHSQQTPDIHWVVGV
ncbi:hypothetical protein N7450_003999 [Penicillium hetheringtonii]|uniref:Uncharacterized protein n=1 Tax=Penicillium hetheringtonii TaxID=911720 RepID=A0AAD6GUP8_9EURO|nr:hypothetical protein N7450_003999 [Penicillium hetheringtonii]